MDFAIIISTFGMVLTGVNQFAFSSDQSATSIRIQGQTLVQAVSQRYDPPALTFPDISNKQERRAFRKRLKTDIKKWKQKRRDQKDDDPTGKALLTVFASFLVVGLLILIANWSCSLSCAGNGGAASFVLLFGGGGVISLFIIGMFALWKSSSPKPQTGDPNTKA